MLFHYLFMARKHHFMERILPTEHALKSPDFLILRNAVSLMAHRLSRSQMLDLADDLHAQVRAVRAKAAHAAADFAII